ncbi:MAG: hypothetical protein IJW66_01270 [Clostridia bacterium]|nr:hypothetical protein [Clostridia bacterium]
MALIDAKLYDDLERDMNKAKQKGEGLSVRLDAIKKDLKKRKRGWLARIIILSIWAVVFVFAVLMAAGVVEFGGTSVAVGEYNKETGEYTYYENAEAEEEDNTLDFALVAALIVPATWTLCFVGFPIGWNWSKDERTDAKNQVYVQHTVRADGTVDTFQSTLVPKVSAGIFSILQGCITMVFSIPIAIVQCFTWKKLIKKIEAIITEVENNDLFVAA